jgi:hypothetical protein
LRACAACWMHQGVGICYLMSDARNHQIWLTRHVFPEDLVEIAQIDEYEMRACPTETAVGCTVAIGAIACLHSLLNCLLAQLAGCPAGCPVGCARVSGSIIRRAPISSGFLGTYALVLPTITLGPLDSQYFCSSS